MWAWFVGTLTHRGSRYNLRAWVIRPPVKDALWVIVSLVVLGWATRLAFLAVPTAAGGR